MASYSLLCNLGRINVARILSSTYPKVAIQSIVLSKPNEKYSTNEGLTVNVQQRKFLTTSQKLNAETTSHGDHSKLWTIERGVSAGLLAIIPAAFMFQTPALDYAMALALTAHVHWGIEALIVDYMRPRLVGEALAKVGIYSIYLLSAFTLGSLFYFNYSDIGITQAIKMLWKL